MQQNIEINQTRATRVEAALLQFRPNHFVLNRFLHHSVSSASSVVPTPAPRVTARINILPLRNASKKNNNLLPRHKKGWAHHYSWPLDRYAEEMIRNHLNCLVEDGINSSSPAD